MCNDGNGEGEQIGEEDEGWWDKIEEGKRVRNRYKKNRNVNEMYVRERESKSEQVIDKNINVGQF